MRKLRAVLAMAAAIGLLSGAPLAAQAAGGKRLILKDGTYQIVAKYEVKGDRVRFLSAERDDWEELPSSMVDWKATNQWNEEHGKADLERSEQPQSGQAGGQAGGQPDTGQSEAAKIDKEESAVRTAEQEQMPRVAAGLNLPNEDGVFVLDSFQGIPELVQITQSSGDVNRGGTHNVLRAAIVSFRGAQEPVRINGQAAKVKLHVEDPALYVSLTKTGGEVEEESAFVVNTHGDDAVNDKNDYSSPASRYVIVRVQVVPGERLIGAIRLRRLNGKIVQSEDIVPTTATILPGGYWMKLTPKEPLTVGEYALMEILAPGEVNLDVWDFGVDPDAAENQHALTPVRGGN